MKIIIEIQNSVYCKVDRSDIDVLSDLLSYKEVYWKQTQFRRKERIEYDKRLITNNGYFLSGFLPKVERFCFKNNIDIEYEGSQEIFEPDKEPSLPGITLRDDQKYLIKRILEKQRGVLVSPTASGKTVVASAIISCFKNAKIVYLCHTVSLTTQAADSFRDFGFKDVQTIMSGKKDFGQITVSTVQSFVNLDPEKYVSHFDIVIVDECHHVSGFSGQYFDVLSKLNAPIRVGFTATMHEDKRCRLACEGLLGQVVATVPINYGVEQKFLAKPIIKMIDVPHAKKRKSPNKYQDIYKHFIVENPIRNNLIVEETIKGINENKTVLILVNLIKHGKILKEELNDRGYDCVFVRGETDWETRSEVQYQLNDKKIKCAIATAVWREGVNIKSLNIIINACGGKSKILTIQSIGRALRVAEGKTSALIIDFKDDEKYLREHSKKRMKIYKSLDA